MKRIISITLYSLLYYIGIASNLEIDGIYYILDENTQTATVTYKGNADDWMFDATGETLYTGNVIIPEKVTYNTKEYTVTTLGDDAFAGCKQLHSLSLPKNISSIGNADDWMFDATGETLYTGNVIRLKYFTTISCPLIMMTRSSFLPLCNL